MNFVQMKVINKFRKAKKEMLENLDENNKEMKEELVKQLFAGLKITGKQPTPKVEAYAKKFIEGEIKYDEFEDVWLEGYGIPKGFLK